MCVPGIRPIDSHYFGGAFRGCSSFTVAGLAGAPGSYHGNSCGRPMHVSLPLSLRVFIGVCVGGGGTIITCVHCVTNVVFVLGCVFMFLFFLL